MARSQADVLKVQQKAALTKSGLFSNGEWPNSAGTRDRDLLLRSSDWISQVLIQSGSGHAGAARG